MRARLRFSFALDAGSRTPSARAGASLPRALDVDDLTVLTGWAEGVAETERRRQEAVQTGAQAHHWRGMSYEAAARPRAAREDHRRRSRLTAFDAGRAREPQGSLIVIKV